MKERKLVPAIIILLFFLGFFINLIITFRVILTPTVLTVITVILLLPFRKDHKAINTLIAITLFLYAIWFLSLIKTIVIPFAIAMILVYISDPVVIYLEKKKIKRSNAILLLTGVIILVFIIFLLFIIPALVNEISGFISQLPSMKISLIEWFNNLQKFELLKKLGEYKIPPYLEEATNKLLAAIQNSASNLSKKSVEFITEFFSNVMYFIIGLLELLIIPVFVFYILEEKNEISRFFKSFIPLEKREGIFSVIDEINITLSTFLRGQLFNSTILGLITAVIYSFIGIKFPLLIGFFTVIMTFIPYVGNILGTSPGLLLAIFTPSPLLSLILVVITMIAIHLLDSYYLYPKVQGKTLRLSPLLIMMSVIIGGQLYGAPGMFLALPLICILKVLCRGCIKRYKVQKEEITQENKLVEDKEESKTSEENKPSSIKVKEEDKTV